MNPSELLPQVYDELRKLAAAKLASEQPRQSIDATALVPEIVLKLNRQTTGFFFLFLRLFSADYAEWVGGAFP